MTVAGSYNLLASDCMETDYPALCGAFLYHLWELCACILFTVCVLVQTVFAPPMNGSQKAKDAVAVCHAACVGISVMPLSVSRCYSFQLSHSIIDTIWLDLHVSLQMLLSPLQTHMTHGFLLKIKTETRGCLVLNICRFCCSESSAKYTKEGPWGSKCN